MPNSATGRDLRVALAMNGGVSLAVWIGGVTSEFYRASRGDGLYGPLSEFVKTNVVIDVLSGASAGGLNGVFAAAAESRQLSPQVFDDLRDVWLSAGSFSNLLRNPTKANPPSLLQGDEVFLREAERVLATWMARTPAPAPQGRSDIDLVLTTTTLEAIPTSITDSEGNRIVDPRHRAQFRFSGSLLRTGDGRVLARQLARAARTSASFPAAFEPSYVHVGAATDTDPDMTGIASFKQSMWAIDGGVLVNKPIGPALELIERHHFDRPGERVLVYVNPDPGRPPAPPAATRDSMPGVLSVVFKALMSLPRAESLADELAEIDDYNRRYGLRRRLRESLLLGIGAASQPVDLEGIATSIYPIWLRRDGISFADRVVRDHLTLIGHSFDDPLDSTVANSRSWVSVSNAIRLARGAVDWYAGAFPAPTAFASNADRSWSYGHRSVDYSAATIVDLLQRAIDLVPSDEASDALTATLLGYRSELEQLREELDVFDTLDALHWASALAVPLPDNLRVWAEDRFKDWPSLAGTIDLPFTVPAASTIRDAAKVWLRGTMERVVKIAVDAAPSCRQVATLAHAWNKETGDNPPSAVLRRLVAAIVNGDPDADDAATADGPDVIMRRLFSLFIVQDLSDDEPAERSRMRLVQLSADTVCPIDPARIASEKVRGLDLGHFGGFMKSSWRANDWMWGRFDGATHLARLLVTPARLRQLYRTKAQCLTALHLALSGSSLAAQDPALANELATDNTLAVVTAAVGDELDFLDSASTRPPLVLQRTTDLVASVLIRIAAARELPALAAAIEQSRREGARESSQAAQLCQQVKTALLPSGRLPLAATDKLIQSSRIGSETMAAEVGSDGLTRTALGLGAVASGVLAGNANTIKPLRVVMKTVRRVLSGLYAVVDSVMSGTRTAAGVLMILLAVGGTIVTARLLGASIATGPLVVGIYLLAGFVALVGVLLGWRRAASSVGLALVIVVLATIDRHDAEILFTDPDDPKWKGIVQWVGAGVLLVSFVAAAVALAFVKKSALAKKCAATGVVAAVVWFGLGWVVRNHMQSSRWLDVARWVHDWRAVLIALAIPLSVAVSTATTRIWKGAD